MPFHTQQWLDRSAVTSMSTAEHQPKLLEALRMFRPTEARDKCGGRGLYAELPVQDYFSQWEAECRRLVFCVFYLWVLRLDGRKGDISNGIVGRQRSILQWFYWLIMWAALSFALSCTDSGRKYMSRCHYVSYLFRHKTPKIRLLTLLPTFVFKNNRRLCKHSSLRTTTQTHRPSRNWQKGQA